MKELKKKLIRVKKLKFTRNIIIGVIALIIVAFIVNIAPGYKRDKYADIVNLVIDENNVTENLKNNVYINENGTIYMSQEDIKNLFDENLYYDEKYNQIITTSYNKVAVISINEKKMTVNDTTLDMKDEIIKINEKIYLPISNMKSIYNIETNYINETNRVIIDNLNNGIIKAKVSENVEMNFRPRTLSKKIGQLKKGEEVYCFYTTSKGWRQIRTKTGIIAYIKAYMLENERIIRQDTNFDLEAQKIKLDLSKENILYKDEQTGANKVWKNIGSEQINESIINLLGDYKTRTKTINFIIDSLKTNNVNGVNIDIRHIQNAELALRFIIEITPKLRDNGITVCVTLNDNIKEEHYNKIVDYIAD